MRVTNLLRSDRPKSDTPESASPKSHLFTPIIDLMRITSSQYVPLCRGHTRSRAMRNRVDVRTGRHCPKAVAMAPTPGADTHQNGIIEEPARPHAAPSPTPLHRRCCARRLASPSHRHRCQQNPLQPVHVAPPRPTTQGVTHHPRGHQPRTDVELTARPASGFSASVSGSSRYQ